MNQIQLNTTLYYNICNNNYYHVINSLNAWNNQQQLNSDNNDNDNDNIEYKSIIFKSTCSSSDKLKVLNLLKTNGISTTSTVTTTSNSISPKKLKKRNIQNANNLISFNSKLLNSLGVYSQKITQYNIEYINNHTSIFPLKTSLLIKEISTPYLNNHLKNEINIITRKINEIINSLVACISLNPELSGKCKLLSTSVLDQYLELQSIINGNLEYIQLRFNSISRMIINYGKSVATALKAADDFYDTIIGIMEWIQTNLVPLSPNTVNLCSIKFKSISWCDFTKTSWYIPPPNSINIPNLLQMPNASEIWNQVASSVESVEILINQSINELTNFIENWENNLEFNVLNTDLFVPKDYNPPKYIYPEELNYQENSTSQNLSVVINVVDNEWKIKSQKFIDNISTSFDDLDKYYLIKNNISFTSFINDHNNYNNYTWRENLNSLKDFINQQIEELGIQSIISQYGFELESFSFPEPIVIATWFQPLFNLSTNLILFDILWRIFQTFRIIYRFWSGTTIKVPPADLRNKSSILYSMNHTFSKVIELIMSTTIQLWVAVFFTIGMIVVILVTLSVSYIPMFDSYKDNCVHNNNANGTFLSKNLYAFGYNYASSFGNQEKISYQNKYNKMRSEDCLKYSTSNENKINEFKNNLTDTLQLYKETSQKMSLIESCIDLDKMDELIQTSCFLNQSMINQCPVNPITNISYPLPGTLLNQKTVLSSIKCNDYDSFSLYISESIKINNNTFTCSNIPLCKFTCDGPNSNILHTISHQCSCSIEWKIHSFILSNLAAIIVYILLNISRYYFYQFLLNIYWEELITEDSFEYIGSCSRSGNMLTSLKPSEINETLEKIKKPMNPRMSKIEIEKLSESYKNKRKTKLSLNSIYKTKNLNQSIKSNNENLSTMKTITPSKIIYPLSESIPLNFQNNSTNSTMNNIIKMKLEESTDWLVTSGYIYLLFSILVNIPWILLILFIRANIDYNPNTDI